MSLFHPLPGRCRPPQSERREYSAAAIFPSTHRSASGPHGTMGLVTYAARQYDYAIVQFKELNAASPGVGDLGLGWCYREKKMYPEAIAALERALADSRHPSVLASVASVYAGRYPYS